MDASTSDVDKGAKVTAGRARRSTLLEIATVLLPDLDGHAGDELALHRVVAGKRDVPHPDARHIALQLLADLGHHVLHGLAHRPVHMIPGEAEITIQRPYSIA